jgi:hypothetical protein
MQWAVNPDPLESEPESFDLDLLQERYQVAAVQLIEENDNLASFLQDARFGQELWKILLLLALLVVVAETLFLKERAVSTE